MCRDVGRRRSTLRKSESKGENFESEDKNLRK